MNDKLPVAVIGAGPIGLAAAAHLLERGLTPLVLEAGTGVGAGMLRWPHVRMFSPWRHNIDNAAATDAACCGGPAPQGADACCVRDADAKAAGRAGCGCDSAPAPTAAPTSQAEWTRVACCR